MLLSLLFIGAQQALVEYQFMKRIMTVRTGAVGMAVTAPGMMMPPGERVLIRGGAMLDDCAVYRTLCRGDGGNV